MTGLEARGITVHVGDADLIRHASFAIPAGAVTALVGPNGAGKSTLLRALAGVERPAAGAVLAGDQDLLALGRRERARRVAFVEQETTTELPLTVRAVVGLGRTPHESLLGGHDPDGERIIDDAMRRAGVTGFAARDVTTLSGGERQRVILARALAQRPRILLLDEPTSHLDVAAQLEVLRLLGELAREGVTVLAAVHDLTLAAHAEQVLVLQRGRIRAFGPTVATMTPELLHEVFGVRAAWARNPLTDQPMLAVSLPDPT